jgi:transcription elongation factor Elf1
LNLLSIDQASAYYERPSIATEPNRPSNESERLSSLHYIDQRQASPESFLANSMPDRMPPASPAMTSKSREMDSSINKSTIPPPIEGKSGSLRSIADDVSNDTTVPANRDRELAEKSQYGSLSEKSSFINQSSTRLNNNSVTNNNYNSFNYSNSRASPSLSHSLLENSQVLQKNNLSTKKHFPDRMQNDGDDDDDDNNTIDKLIENNLFIPGDSPFSRSKSMESVTKWKQQSVTMSGDNTPSVSNRNSRNFSSAEVKSILQAAQSNNQYHPDGQQLPSHHEANQHDEIKENPSNDSESPPNNKNVNNTNNSSNNNNEIESQNIPNFDDYTFQSDLESRTEQNTLNTNTLPEDEEEDHEATFNRLKFNTLKRVNSAVTMQTKTSNYPQSPTGHEQQQQRNSVRTSLKPAAKSLQMGKQKILTSQSESIRNLSPNSRAIQQSKEKEKMIGKTVNERLYHNAELMKKKKEYLVQKNEQKKLQQMDLKKFKLNEGSQKIIESIQNRGYNSGRGGGDNQSQGSNVTDIGIKLYQEGIQSRENKKKKSEKVEKLKENFIDTWSCVKCGVHHKVSSSKALTTTPQMWGDSERYVCSNCGFNNQEAVESSKPTNVGLLYNEELKENYEKHRKQNRLNPEIHEHLYQAGKQHEQVLQLNRALWEDLNEKMSFKPTISEQSNAIINAYKHSEAGTEHEETHSFNDMTKGSNLENDEAEEDKITLGKVNKTKITGQRVKEYFAKPIYDRLIHTQTRSYVDEAMEFHKKQTTVMDGGRTTFAHSKNSLLASKSQQMDSSVASNQPKEHITSRLYNEFEEINRRKDERTNQFYTYDVNTGQQLWKPKVSSLPEDYPVKITASSTPGRKRNIWNEIIRKDKEMLEDKLSKQRKAIEKTLEEISKNQVKALPTSNEILQHSTNKNLEDLYKLLLVNTHPLNNALPDRPPSAFDDESSETKQHVNNNVNEQDESDSTLSSSVGNQQKNSQVPLSISTNDKIRKDMLHLQNPTHFPAHFLKRPSDNDEIDSNYSSSIPADTNTIVSERQLNEVLNSYLQDWKEKKLDLLLINPNLLINEISTLLLDMKLVVFNQWLTKQRKKLLEEKNLGTTTTTKDKSKSHPKRKSDNLSTNTDEYQGDDNDLESETVPKEEDYDDEHILKLEPERLLISFPEFVRLALKCIKRRNGPGKGYIFAPKKKLDLAIQMKLHEYSEETFHPEIGKNSEAIISQKRHIYQPHDGSASTTPRTPLPIEIVLTEDGKRIQKKLEILREEKKLKEEEGLTFKPHLYKPPSYVVARYRGLDLSNQDEENDGNFDDERDVETRGGGTTVTTEERGKHSMRSVTSQQTGANTITSGGIHDIPNVMIASKGSGAGQGKGPTVIRGGASGTGTNNSVLSSKAGPSDSSSMLKRSPSKDSRSVFSDSVASSSAANSPTKGPPVQLQDLMTPPHVRQTRLMNQIECHPPPAPPTTTTTSTTTTSSAAAKPQHGSPSSHLISSSRDSQDSSYQRHKDDISIFTLTESAASIPTLKNSQKLLDEKRKQLEKFNQKNSYLESHQMQQYRQPSPNLRIDSSSLESHSPPLSVSSGGTPKGPPRQHHLPHNHNQHHHKPQNHSHQRFTRQEMYPEISSSHSQDEFLNYNQNTHSLKPTSASSGPVTYNAKKTGAGMTQPAEVTLRKTNISVGHPSSSSSAVLPPPPLPAAVAVSSSYQGGSNQRITYESTVPDNLKELCGDGLNLPTNLNDLIVVSVPNPSVDPNEDVLPEDGTDPAHVNACRWRQRYRFNPSMNWTKPWVSYWLR